MLKTETDKRIRSLESTLRQLKTKKSPDMAVIGMMEKELAELKAV